MSQRPEIRFVALDAPASAVVAALVGQDLHLPPALKALDQKSQGAVVRAAKAADFKGKAKSSIEILSPERLEMSRLHLVGTAQSEGAGELDWMRAGATAYAAIHARKTPTASLIAEAPDKGAPSADELAALLAYGALLRSYNFRKYRTRPARENNNGEPEPEDKPSLLYIHCKDPRGAEKAFADKLAVADGVFAARDLVNEPANALGPVEFADRAQELSSLGLEVEVLDPDALEKLGMGALLGVAQGSTRPARVVIMQWAGAKSKRTKPVCIIGKGVVFDSGGLSMKPAAGMEDMKGDMGGAACVVGLMRALAARKAAVNAIGVIGLVENMVSGAAQRPGDIVKSMSGQTIEVLNTDAEGRLVLADVVWYAQERFKPRLMVDLATLTGAIMVALGKEHAGLFSNDDKLAAEIAEAGLATGEKVWRMPLGKAYDKLLDSKNADMKNIGGRLGGAITAAQFIQRFVKDTPWAHLDIAGTAMDSVKDELNQGWASGWGVRLLDRMIADNYEKAEK
ncbi:MAG: leucyl aminopeptidase [Hyphomicrobium sp. SCN 65-11]|nr:MAG: leucyl aminopeptidase [Hyphomicrobium sp. SCN 65-11]